MIPENWELLIIYLKDYFFTILLYKDDAERFAFSVPSISKAEPAKQYHWVVLPKDMHNSPTMCQMYVAWALEPMKQKYPQLLIYHYMDDILVAGHKMANLPILKGLTETLENRSLKIAPEKTQKQEP